MKSKHLICLAIASLIFSVTHAQIKKQFKDHNDGLTTIVVKVEGANDADILNDQFDIEEMGMHQVIRITTEEDIVTSELTPVLAPKVPVAVQPTENEFTEKGVVTAQLKPVIHEEKPEPKTIVINATEEQKAGPVKEQTNQSGEKQTLSYSNSSSSRTAFKPYYSKKRFKKKKRKKVKRSGMQKGRCYRF